jgi:hypothetical protein
LPPLSLITAALGVLEAVPTLVIEPDIEYDDNVCPLTNPVADALLYVNAVPS